MKSESEPRKGLDQFTKDVLYSALVGVTSKVLGWAALLMVGLGVALIAAGWKMPAWTFVAMLFLALVLIYATKRAATREARELRPKVARVEDQLDRYESYGSILCSVLDTFQKIVAKDIQLPMSTFIERGILTPARDVMQENGHPADLRMSVLLVSEGHFSMVWASGHNIESQKKFKVPVEKTISQVAYEKQAIQVWKNAPAEERSFVKNPKATRGFKSMVSMPISKGDSTQGVFNVVTATEDCFDPADINYLTSLGAIIQLAFGLALTEIQVQREAKAQQEQLRRPRGAKVAARGVRALNPARAPGENVGSSGTADRTEASDG